MKEEFYIYLTKMHSDTMFLIGKDIDSWMPYKSIEELKKIYTLQPGDRIIKVTTYEPKLEVVEHEFEV